MNHDGGAHWLNHIARVDWINHNCTDWVDQNGVDGYEHSTNHGIAAAADQTHHDNKYGIDPTYTP